MEIIAIDIGGTEIKYGKINIDGKIIIDSSILTGIEKGSDILLKKIYYIIDLLKNDKTIGIAISCTGQIDSKAGKIIGGTEFISEWIGLDLVDILQERYNLPTILENDVNCAALGEMWQGVAKNKENFICLTIGTGIGGAIVLNKSLYRGEDGIAGEFGHILLESTKRKKCSCGIKGCYQAYASMTALINLVEENTGEKLSGLGIFERVHKNDIQMIKILEEWIEYITDGLSTLIYVFNPRLIIIGGAVSKQGDFLKNKIMISLEKKVMPSFLKRLKVEMALKQNNAGILGATYLLLKKIEFK